jgi:hypothetical protein
VDKQQQQQQEVFFFFNNNKKNPLMSALSCPSCFAVSRCALSLVKAGRTAAWRA